MSWQWTQSGPDTHILGLQCENCLTGDTITGIMNEKEEDKVHMSLFPAKKDQIPNSSCQDSKQFIGPYKYPITQPWHRKDNFRNPAEI